MWSSLRNIWSKCEILKIAEGAKRVLNLSNGMEEIVNPANVWNGTPRLGESPFEILFQIGGKIFASCHQMTLQLNKRGLEVIQKMWPISQSQAALKQVVSQPDRQSI